MQNIINRPFLTIWLPSGVMTAVVITLSVFGINFARNIFDFVVGDSYDMSSVLIGLAWLFSASWTLLAFLNRSTFQNGPLDQSNTHSSLYKITSIRDSALKYVSASNYNNESRNVIREYNPSSRQLTDEVIAHKSVPESDPIPVPKSDHEVENGRATETVDPSVPPLETPAKNSTTTGNVIINTAIKGESYATDQAKAKYRDSLKKIADKKNKKMSAT